MPPVTQLLGNTGLGAILLLGLACNDSSSPSGPGSEPDDAIFVGAGDIARCTLDGHAITAALLDDIEGTVFTTGDNVYDNGTTSEFANCYDSEWGRHKARTRPTAGNHDYNTTGAAPYYAYFGDLAGPAGRGYYSYDVGAWHVIALNSNVSSGATSAQIQWLREDLAANETKCAVALWHHPVFSSGYHGNNSKMAELWRVLDSAGVDLALVGHDHNYERFAPQDYQGNANPNGIRQIVIGTGGTNLRPFETIRANSEVRDASTWGVLKLTLRAASYEWEFVAEPGKTFSDVGSTECRD